MLAAAEDVALPPLAAVGDAHPGSNKTAASTTTLSHRPRMLVSPCQSAPYPRRGQPGCGCMPTRCCPEIAHPLAGRHAAWPQTTQTAAVSARLRPGSAAGSFRHLVEAAAGRRVEVGHVVGRGAALWRGEGPLDGVPIWPGDVHDLVVRARGLAVAPGAPCSSGCPAGEPSAAGAPRGNGGRTPPDRAGCRR